MLRLPRPAQLMSPARTATPSDTPAPGAAEAVRALRGALCNVDVEQVQRVRWLAPRPPGERDLLSDLAAAEGLAPALRRLSRFWRRVDARLERVRLVDDCEVEVYERLSVAGESLPIVSLVRRETKSSSWRVVCTNEAYDERFVIWTSCPADAVVDDVAWSRAFEERHGLTAELLMDGPTGVLGSPAHGWLAQVRSPFVPSAWPPSLPGEDDGRVLEVATALTPDLASRHEQLDWILRATDVFAEQLGGLASFLPAHKKLVVRGALRRAAAGALEPDQAFAFWAQAERLGGHVVTSGLRQLGLPEVEAPVDAMPTPQATTRLVQWIATKLLSDDSGPPIPGTEVLARDRTFVIAAGRRGPRRGTSYGRWGAIALRPTTPNFRRSSRARLRVPDDIR